MRHLYLFIHLVRQSQFRQGVVLDNQFSLLQPGNGLFYFLIIAPRHSKKVFYHAVGNGLLLHDERILRIGIEIKILALETVHILRGKNNAQSLVPAHGNKVAKRMVRERTRLSPKFQLFASVVRCFFSKVPVSPSRSFSVPVSCAPSRQNPVTGFCLFLFFAHDLQQKPPHVAHDLQQKSCIFAPDLEQELMFRRHILKKLEAWKANAKHKPLILRGARQVGKTTVVNEFGTQFDNYLYFNLENPESIKLFEMEIPLDDLVNMLYASLGKSQKGGSTLIFIDEIQNSPKTIALLRYFYEQRPDLYVIAAGSLLENLVDVKVSFPVGRVQYLALRPCSFYEFLGAIGKNNLLAILAQKAELTIAFHEQLMHLFNQYTIIGGMPEAVQQYAETQDIIAIEDVYETLVQAYKDDSEKYVKGNKLTDVVRFILSYGWAFSGETITLGNFANSGYKSREVGEAFRLLEKAMLLELVYPVSSTQMPIIPETKRMPKLIWFDTGLVNYQAGIRKEIIGSTEMVDRWRGHIAEQITAQELLAMEDRVGQHRSFWARPNNGAEVDFLFTHESKLYPIEVKSGTNSHLRSLQSFMDNSDIDIAIRIWSNPYSVDKLKTPNGKEFRLINLPFYLIGRLHQVLEEIITIKDTKSAF